MPSCHPRHSVWAIALGMILSVAGALQAETLWCRSLGVDDGLSQNFVTAIAQDRDGFLWFGTVGGLSRWDGYQFSRHTKDETSDRSLSDIVILSLHVDPQGRLWAGTRVGLNEFDPAAQQFNRHPVWYGSDEARNDRVDGIASDRSGGIWMASFSDGGVHRYDPTTGRGRAYKLPGMSHRWVTAIHVDRQDRLWVGTQTASQATLPSTNRYDLLVMDRCSEAGGRTPLPAVDALGLDPSGGRVVTLMSDAENRLWIGRDGGGVIRFNPATKEVQRVPVDPPRPGALASGSVRDMALGRQGEVWVLMSELVKGRGESMVGLSRVEADTLRVRRFNAVEFPARLWSDFKPHCLAMDRSGVVWIGSNGGGLRQADISAVGFEVFRRQSAMAEGLNSSFVRAVCVGQDGIVWVGTPAGLNRIDRSTGEPRYSSSPGPGFPELPQTDVKAVHEDRRRRLWIATPRGVVESDARTGSVLATHRRDPSNPCSLSDEWVQVIHEDPVGRLWFGTQGHGISLYDEERGCFRNTTPDAKDPTALPNGTVQALFTDGGGRLWVGTDGGLSRLVDPVDGGGFRFHRVPGLAGRTVMAIAQSPLLPEVLWVGTLQHGLCRLDLRDESCRFFSVQNSLLPDNTIYGVLPDRAGRLWMSSNQGLACLDPVNETLDHYPSQPGLQSREFNALAFCRASDGELFFGGVAGLNAFHPERLSRNPHPPGILLTSVSTTDRSTRNPEVPNANLFRLGQTVEPEAIIPNAQRDLTFEFVALHNTASALNTYQYRLDDYDLEWQGPVSIRRVRYTNLDPGRYTFRVRAFSGHGVPSRDEARYSFTVLPPIHKTLWFRSLVSLAVLGLVLGGHWFRIRSLRRQRTVLESEVSLRTSELRAALAKVEGQAAKLQALDKAKSQFFANISHEFRTPIMLTQGPLQDVHSGMHGPVTEDAREEISLALRNTRRLLELVDQLLLLARLDAGEPDFRPKELRLDRFLVESARLHAANASRSMVQFVLDIPKVGIVGDFDLAKLDQIIGNLVGNAVKFTPPGGTVTLRVSAPAHGWVTVDVDDTGPGIPERDLPRIFERFYRGGQENGSIPGTGIGLAIARECVELHGGEIQAQNIPSGGARLSVRLRARICPEESPLSAQTHPVE